MLDRFETIRTLFDVETLAVVANALRLLPSAFHGLSDLADLDLPRLTRAASDYLRSAEPYLSAADGHPLGLVLSLFSYASDTPRDESRPV